jgi:hypothetical protein
MSSIFVGLKLVLYLNFNCFYGLFLTVEQLDLTDYHYAFLGTQEYQPKEELMSTSPKHDESARTLVPSKVGKQPVGIGVSKAPGSAAPKTPCTGKVDAVQAEEISSDDDFEKIAGMRKGKSAAATVVGRGGKNDVIARRIWHLSLET